jgi:prepilin-type N-terminal cleavage/methylation domain-containing protein
MRRQLGTRESKGAKGFTLTEIIVTVLLVGVGVGLFNGVFVNNWSAYEDRIKRANFSSEITQLFEAMSIEGRNSRLIDLTNTASEKTAVFTNAADSTKVTTFKITDTGSITSTRGVTVKTFSTHADFANCTFTKNGKGLVVDLKLKDNLFNRDITTTASIEILPRN